MKHVSTFIYRFRKSLFWFGAVAGVYVLILLVLYAYFQLVDVKGLITTGASAFEFRIYQVMKPMGRWADVLFTGWKFAKRELPRYELTLKEETGEERKRDGVMQVDEKDNPVVLDPGNWHVEFTETTPFRGWKRFEMERVDESGVLVEALINYLARNLGLVAGELRFVEVEVDGTTSVYLMRELFSKEFWEHRGYAGNTLIYSEADDRWSEDPTESVKERLDMLKESLLKAEDPSDVKQYIELDSLVKAASYVQLLESLGHRAQLGWYYQSESGKFGVMYMGVSGKQVTKEMFDRARMIVFQDSEIFWKRTGVLYHYLGSTMARADRDELFLQALTKNLGVSLTHVSGDRPSLLELENIRNHLQDDIEAVYLGHTEAMKAGGGSYELIRPTDQQPWAADIANGAYLAPVRVRRMELPLDASGTPTLWWDRNRDGNLDTDDFKLGDFRLDAEKNIWWVEIDPLILPAITLNNERGQFEPVAAKERFFIQNILEQQAQDLKIFARQGLTDEKLRLPQEDIDAEFLPSKITNSIEHFKLSQAVFRHAGGSTFVMDEGVHYLTKSVVIPSGLNILIRPGAELVGSENAWIISESALTIGSSAGKPVRLRAAMQGRGWGGIGLIGPMEGESVIENVYWEGSRGGVVNGISLQGGLTGYQAKVVIRNSVFENNLSDAAVAFAYGYGKIENTKVVNNQKHGVRVAFADGLIRESEFSGNKESGLFFHSAWAIVFDSLVDRNGRNGIETAVMSSPRIYNSRIFNNPVGIFISDASHPRVEYSNVQFNKVGVKAALQNKIYKPQLSVILNNIIEKNEVDREYSEEMDVGDLVNLDTIGYMSGRSLPNNL